MKAPRTASIILAALLLSGCSATEAPNTDSGRIDSGPSAAQHALLTRDTIGFDEYKEAFANYSRCIEDAGYTMTPPVLNPTDGRRYLSRLDPTPGKRINTELENSCDPRELSSVEREYLRQNPPEIDPVLRAEIFGQLTQKNIAFTGNEKQIADFFPNKNEDQPRVKEVTAIIEQATRKLFPDLPYIRTGF
ncbi:hypothetical protein ACL9RE_06350 [Mycetocola saprophilus]